jgi:hypothetical protein
MIANLLSSTGVHREEDNGINCFTADSDDDETTGKMGSQTLGLPIFTPSFQSAFKKSPLQLFYC